MVKRQGAAMNEVRNEDFGELRIELDPKYGWATYIGTRNQLEAEGIIPADFAWLDGFRRYEWESNGIFFKLHRARPPVSKGSWERYFDSDSWVLSMCADRRRYDVDAMRLAQEVERLIYQRTKAWRRECDEHFRHFNRAQDDKAFQAFKALMPCLAPPPESRRRRPVGKEVSHD
ncbi:hypothetical protein [Burkholderia glumae]|uniref:hypothetical protein n=1 Tax=Burkholderia glumae TaxID=337 RepID=UPI0020CC7E90|nr:hypothetical protein [Burkholderia glumae]MCQ0029683.1 hypothetical protein [Burkholderia glumae]MCQ0035497.1 hypothetical protein [Burkholderia glumae]